MVFYKDIFPFQVDKDVENFVSLPLPLDHDMDSVPIDVERTGEEPIGRSKSHEQPETQTSEASQRRDTGQRRTLDWLSDYIVNIAIIKDSSGKLDSSAANDAHASYMPSTFPYNVSKSLNKAYVNFLTNISAVYEPHNYEQARKKDEWIQAMKQEIKALEDNKTWVVTDLPPDKIAIGNKWVYKVKKKTIWHH